MEGVGGKGGNLNTRYAPCHKYDIKCHFSKIILGSDLFFEIWNYGKCVKNIYWRKLNKIIVLTITNDN